MIVGIGTDLVSIARIERLYQRHPERFVQRILASSELAAFYSSCNKPAFLAKRFAVKEAAAKALGLGIRSGLTFRDFRVHRDPKGQPVLSLEGKASRIAKSKKIQALHLSISDERTHALAFVVLED